MLQCALHLPMLEINARVEQRRVAQLVRLLFKQYVEVTEERCTHLAGSKWQLQFLIVMCMPHVIKLPISPLLIFFLFVLLGSLLGLLLFVVACLLDEPSRVFTLRCTAKQHDCDHLFLPIRQRCSSCRQELRTTAKRPCQLSLLLLDL